MPDNENELPLLEELRRAAADITPGEAPVEAIIRRGRALRARRRLAAALGTATACVLAVVLAAGLANRPAGTQAARPGGAGAATAAPAHPTGAPTPDTGGAIRRVQPYERVLVDEHTVLGLLPEGEQNYVVTDPADFDEQIETARHYPGRNVPPGSIGAGIHVADGDVLLEGVWRLDEIPARITIESTEDHVARPASMVMLTGESDWGVFYLAVPRPVQLPRTFHLTAYDEQGRVLATDTATQQ